MKELYNKLMELYREIAIISEISSVLGWDQMTMMPPKGNDQRSDQFAYLYGLIHEKGINPEILKLITQIKENSNYDTMSKVEKRNIELIKRGYDRSTKVPKELVQEIALHYGKSDEIYREAKKTGKFDLVKEPLEKWLKLLTKYTQFIDSSKSTLDVLIDDHEWGFTTERYTNLFNELKAGLMPLVDKILSCPNQPDFSLLKRRIPVPLQKKLGEDLMPFIGYDLEGGRLDISVHPFTNGVLDDVRITTLYDEENFWDNMSSVTHEGGHAIYEQNLPREYRRQPVCNSASSGMHEAQARFLENIIARSSEFWEFYFPKFQEILSPHFDDVELDSFVHAINNIQNTPIRVLADEITYALHIILRFEIERDFFSGKIKVEDLPSIWNAKMKEYLNIDIKNDKEGILQDIHWPTGGFGYFPSYTLGNLYGAQLLHKLKQDMPEWREYLRKGEIKIVVKWLNTNVHQKGGIYDPLELIKEVTGEELSPKYFIEYLKEKYSKIYNIEL